jgi:hypothetical protein
LIATSWLLEMSFDYVGNRPGTYRFLYYLTRDSAGKYFVGESLRASPSFELKL